MYTEYVNTICMLLAGQLLNTDTQHLCSILDKTLAECFYNLK